MSRKPQRVQRAGKQKPWTFEEIKAGLAKFFEDYSRHPTAHEVDRYEYLALQPFN